MAAPPSNSSKVLLRQVAEKQGVAAKMIATTDELEALASDDNSADVPAMKGWRRQLFGEKALRLKHGRLALTVENNRVVTLEWHEAQDEDSNEAPTEASKSA